MPNEKDAQNTNVVERVCGIAGSFADRFIENHLRALSQFDDDPTGDAEVEGEN